MLLDKVFTPSPMELSVAPLPQELLGNRELSLEALVLCAGDSNYLSQHFRQTASLGLLEAKGTSRLDVEVQAISSTLRSVYAWEADVCYPLVHGIWNLATL